jgi:hypothetical protein
MYEYEFVLYVTNSSTNNLVSYKNIQHDDRSVDTYITVVHIYVCIHMHVIQNEVRPVDACIYAYTYIYIR